MPQTRQTLHPGLRQHSAPSQATTTMQPPCTLTRRSACTTLRSSSSACMPLPAAPSALPWTSALAQASALSSWHPNMRRWTQSRLLLQQKLCDHSACKHFGHIQALLEAHSVFFMELLDSPCLWQYAESHANHGIDSYIGHLLLLSSL